MHIRGPHGLARRTRHTVRGEVVGHFEQSSGFWLWKKTYYSLRLKVLDEEVPDFIQTVRDKTLNSVTPPTSTTGDFEEDKVQRDAFAIGQQVILSYSTAAPREEFFEDGKPFRWESPLKKFEPELITT